MKYIDVHSHTIPGIDDGSESMEMSLRMIRMEAEQGAEVVFCTSHSLSYSVDRVRELFDQLVERVAEEGISVTLKLGLEIDSDSYVETIDETLEKVKSGLYPTYNGTNHLLVEFHPDVSPEKAKSVVERYVTEGYKPVLAHVERYPELTINNVKELKDMGALIQINAYSVCQEASQLTKSRAKILVEHQLADFIGSDAHRVEHRPPEMATGIQFLYDNYDQSYVDRLVYQNAMDMLICDDGYNNTEDYWLDGIMGVVVGDALGCPVQFLDRSEIEARGNVSSMEGYGTFNMPPGTWTDDSALTIALMSSIRETGEIDLEDIMNRFSDWLELGDYTPFQQAFDIGGATMDAIRRYELDGDVTKCGGTTEYDNGNGSLMRILPACLYVYKYQHKANLTDQDAIRLIDSVSGLTHNHTRAKIGCGLYYFCVRAILDESGDLKERLSKGLDDGFSFYSSFDVMCEELVNYDRLRDLDGMTNTAKDEISASGYVVKSLEAAVWAAITTSSYEECELCCVNLGDDTDTVAAIAGGLAGLYYGYEGIPTEWLDVIQRRDWIEGLLRK